MRLQLTNHTKQTVDLESLERAALLILDFLKEDEDCEISLVLVGEAEGRQLNETYRHKQGATDVLSFSFREVYETSQEPFQTSDNFLGEIVITAPRMRKQAAEADHPESTEMLVLFMHGLLHLLGYNHEEGGEMAQEMAALEDRLYKKLALPVTAHDRYQTK